MFETIGLNPVLIESGSWDRLCNVKEEKEAKQTCGSRWKNNSVAQQIRWEASEFYPHARRGRRGYCRDGSKASCAKESEKNRNRPCIDGFFRFSNGPWIVGWREYKPVRAPLVGRCGNVTKFTMVRVMKSSHLRTYS